MVARQLTLRTPSNDRWFGACVLGRAVRREGKLWRIHGVYFARDPDSATGEVCQWCIAEEVRPDETPGWYLIRTRRGKELVADLALQDAGLVSLAPVVLEEWPPDTDKSGRGRRKGAKREDVVEPLFPGYVFVRLASGDVASWHKVRRTHGVEGVVEVGGEPLRVPDGVVDAILDASAGSGIIVYRRERLCAFALAHRAYDDDSSSLFEMLERHLSGEARVRALMEMMDRRGQ